MDDALSPNVQEQILPPGGERYTISIPSNYSSDNPVPLVLVLHYGYVGEVTPFYGRTLLTEVVEPALRELGAIMVAPDCTTGHWANPESEAMISKLLEHMEKNYTIDSKKMLITGYSMGGIGTWYLAGRMKKRFSAAIIMAGTPPENIDTTAWEIPLYIIHSSDDEIMPFELTELAVKELKNRGVLIELVVLENVSHYEENQFVEPLRETVSWIKNRW